LIQHDEAGQENYEHKKFQRPHGERRKEKLNSEVVEEDVPTCE
jgi:hypothetical protein